MAEQYGVRFHDGSVRKSWNGRTQRKRAEECLERLRSEYPRDDFALVYRTDRFYNNWQVVSE